VCLSDSLVPGVLKRRGGSFDNLSVEGMGDEAQSWGEHRGGPQIKVTGLVKGGVDHNLWGSKPGVLKNERKDG